MKAYHTMLRTLLTGMFLSVVLIPHAQEIDDMYFTKKDRKKVSYDVKATSDDASAVMSSYNQDEYTETYTARDVNPDYIAKYRALSMGEQEMDENPNYGIIETQNTETSYVPEESSTSDLKYAIDNAYAENGRSYSSSSTNNQPNWSNSYGMGFSPYGNSSMFSISYGMGSGMFYNPYMMMPVYYSPYDPWYNPYNRYSSIYWGPSYYGSSYGYGYDPFYRGGSSYYSRVNVFCPTYYGNSGQYTSTGNAYREVKRREKVTTGRGTDSYATGSRDQAQPSISTRSYTGTSRTARPNISTSQNEYYKEADRAQAAQAFSRVSSSSTRSKADSRAISTAGSRSVSNPSSFNFGTSTRSSATQNMTDPNTSRRYSTSSSNNSSRFGTSSSSSNSNSRSSFSTGTSRSGASFSPSRSSSGTRSSGSSGNRSSSSSSSSRSTSGKRQ